MYISNYYYQNELFYDVIDNQSYYCKKCNNIISDDNINDHKILPSSNFLKLLPYITCEGDLPDYFTDVLSFIQVDNIYRSYPNAQLYGDYYIILNIINIIEDNIKLKNSIVYCKECNNPLGYKDNDVYNIIYRILCFG